MHEAKFRLVDLELIRSDMQEAFLCEDPSSSNPNSTCCVTCALSDDSLDVQDHRTKQQVPVFMAICDACMSISEEKVEWVIFLRYEDYHLIFGLHYIHPSTQYLPTRDISSRRW